jgi:hypothetical protein
VVNANCTGRKEELAREKGEDTTRGLVIRGIEANRFGKGAEFEEEGEGGRWIEVALLDTYYIVGGEKVPYRAKLMCANLWEDSEQATRVPRSNFDVRKGTGSGSNGSNKSRRRRREREQVWDDFYRPWCNIIRTYITA